MDTVISTLMEFGLSTNEAVVFREIVKQHETNPFAISRATKIPRTTVYEILTSLALKDLIDLKKSDGLSKQQTRIIAKDPSYLRTIIRNRKNELTRLDADVVHILPVLKKDYVRPEPNADFQFFPGIDGAKKVFIDSCLDDVDLPEYLFNYKIADDVFGREVVNKIVDSENKRKRKYVPKEILPLTDWTRHCVVYQYERNPHDLHATEMRFIDQPGFDIDNKISVKGSRVWIVSVKGKECWGSITRSESYANSLISIFNVLWNIATPITKNIIDNWRERE